MYFLISVCWVVSIDTIPSIPELDSEQNSFNNLGNLVPTEKIRNTHRKLRLEEWEQTLLLHSPLRFSQHAVTFIPLWKISDLLLPR